MSTFLITGIAGFIGSNLAQSLLDKGHDIIGLDNFLTGKTENLGEFASKISFVNGDIRDTALLRDLCKSADYVLHHAAMASVPWSVKDPLLAHEHNVTGTLSLLQAAKEAGVKKVVMAVTSAAYGDSEILPCTESLPSNPLSPYAATKLMGEMYLSLYSRLYGLPTIGLRYFNVFGKRQDPGSAYAAAIPIFVKKVLAGQAPVIFGDGRQTRDFVYIEDVVQANLLACGASAEADGCVMNIGTGKAVTVLEICQKIIQLLGSTVEPIFAAKREGDVLHSVSDISLARRLINFEPKYDVFSGLDATIDWYKTHLI